MNSSGPTGPSLSFEIRLRSAWPQRDNGRHDLFTGNEQSDLFGADTVPAYRPDPDKVRARLHKILRALVFRQPVGHLREDEGAQLRFQFDSELERLEKAA